MTNKTLQQEQSRVGRKVRARRLVDLPGCAEAAAEVLAFAAVVRPQDVRHAGLWAPPESVDFVTAPLVYNIAVAARRHAVEVARRRRQSAPVVSLAQHRLFAQVDRQLVELRGVAWLPPVLDGTLGGRLGWEPDASQLGNANWPANDPAVTSDSRGPNGT